MGQAMLKIGTEDYRALRHHGEETYPNECCGVLLGTFDGDIRSVRRIVPCQNASLDSPRSRYRIDPIELVRAQRGAREQGLEIVGFYHSHPDHPAQWSTTDLEEAHWISCSYLITAIENGCAAQSNSFVLSGTLEEDKQLREEELLIVDV
jgi:proteasome lid subunit RPN8/RPN11